MKNIFSKKHDTLKVVNLPPEKFNGITKEQMEEYMKLTGCNGKGLSCPIHSNFSYACCTNVAYCDIRDKIVKLM
jgi:hypothetical protein